jgi:hypothetical protein
MLLLAVRKNGRNAKLASKMLLVMGRIRTLSPLPRAELVAPPPSDGPDTSSQLAR